MVVENHMPLTGAKLMIAAIAVSLATFMSVLDTTIANVSIPAMAGDLAVPPSQGTWVIIAFVIANAIVLPLTGWLTQRIGMVRLFVGSILAFTLTSLLCGLAPSFDVLLVCRFLQGAVAGPMIPISQALLLSSFPKHKAGLALSIWAMTAVVAPVAGPILGGIITDDYSWPWIFYINVPVGLLVSGLCWRIYRHRETATRKSPIDLIGLLFLVLWVGALQITLEKGLELDWFASGKIVFLTVIAVLAFLIFVARELTCKVPVVELRLFMRRNFSLGVIALGVGYGLFLASVVLIPLWLQTRLHYTATWAGLATAPIGILAVVMSPWVGKRVGRTDSRILATGAFLIFAAVMLMRTQYTQQADFISLMLPQFIQGAAIALFLAPLTNLSLSGLKPHEIPLASGLSNFVRITFGGIAISIATTIWDFRTSFHYARLMENITPYNYYKFNDAFQALDASVSEVQQMAIIKRMLDDQASLLAINDLFGVQSVCFLFLIIVIWGIRNPKTETAQGHISGVNK